MDGRIVNSEGATLSGHAGLRVMGSSHGFLGGYKTSRHSLGCAVVGRQGEEMQRDHWFFSARDHHDLETPAAVGRKAGERTIQRLGTRHLTTRRVPVVFAADVAGGLFGNFVSAVKGGNLYRNASFLVDHLGKQVFPEFMHIHEQPLLKKALGSAPYDHEGVATQARDIVSGGILQGYVLDSYAACKLGMPTTGNAGGVRNLTIDPGGKDLPALLRAMDTGLLVTELIGFGVNLVTGDYSRGVAGFSGRRRGDPLPGRCDHGGRQPQRHVSRHHRSGQRCRSARQCPLRLGVDRTDDGCRRVKKRDSPQRRSAMSRPFRSMTAIQREYQLVLL